MSTTVMEHDPGPPPASLALPHDVAASLVLLRDAALVGGYADGQDRVATAFARTARIVIAAPPGRG